MKTKYLQQTIRDFNKLYNFSLKYIKNPQSEIQRLPEIQWSSLLISHALIVSFTSLLSALSHLSIIFFFIALFIISTTHTFSLIIGATVIYFLFSLFYYRRIQYKTMLLLMLFSSIPFLVFSAFSNHSIFFFILGSLLSLILLITGCRFYFRTDTVQTLKVALAPFFLLFSLKLGVTLLTESANDISPQISIEKKNLDTLEKEINP